jgi:hypothetical protein
MTIKKSSPRNSKKQLTLRRETIRDLTTVKDKTVRGGAKAGSDNPTCVLCPVTTIRC